MTTKLKYFVGGEWKDTTSGEYYEITNSSTGEVSLMVDPGAGMVTAGFEFDVPVRFDADTIEVNLSAFEGGGHRGAGGCTFGVEKADDYIPRILKILLQNASNDPE